MRNISFKPKFKKNISFGVEYNQINQILVRLA